MNRYLPTVGEEFTTYGKHNPFESTCIDKCSGLHEYISQFSHLVKKKKKKVLLLYIH